MALPSVLSISFNLQYVNKANNIKDPVTLTRCTSKDESFDVQLDTLESC